MAASDSTYRNVKTLHVVFAVSSVAMLVTIIAMFAEDYYRSWKVEQRIFYDVEEEMAKRALLASAPSEAEFERINELEKSILAKKDDIRATREAMEKDLGDLPARKMKTETEYASVKADFDSIMSFYNQDPGNAKLKARIDELGNNLVDIKKQVEANQANYDAAAAAKGIPQKEKELAELEKEHKKLLADFDRFLKLVALKKWTWRQTVRDLPVLESFASATRIQQYTLNDLPIDYSFKHVTRYDRCTTCHLGMEKEAFDAASLAQLSDDPGTNKELRTRFMGAKKLLESRSAAGVKDLPDPSRIEPKRIAPDRLTEGRIKQFATHPRLNLFVDANSPHSAEKFGCSICHNGQGSATAFYEASHSPPDMATQEKWKEKYHWKSNHYWDFPMQSSRFIESSCLKCHHEVTDLISHGSKVEAPKLVKGYNTVRDLGCFGCHEISGFKAGRRIGPDLRLEPDPPIESLSPTERAKALSDPLNPPGDMRKVGPNLARVSEKTNEDWLRSWLKSPRGFRENTRMPHFYNQPNNLPEFLPEDQKKFPDTEIHAISYYLMQRSKLHLNELKQIHPSNAAEMSARAARTKADRDREEAIKMALATPARRSMLRLTVIGGDEEALARELNTINTRTKSADSMSRLAPPIAAQALPAATNGDRGRMLFQEKGCMACHSHEGTETKPGAAVDGKVIPTIAGDAAFGSDLSRLGHKLSNNDDGKRWLVSWIMNPSGHNPRTLMPYTQLTLQEAGDIATWLLSQKPAWDQSADEKVAALDSAALASMAKLYLRKVLTISEVDDVLEGKKGFTVGRLKQLAADADEWELGGDISGKADRENIPLDDNKLKMYVGKKAIGNMGCYACHNIPGFEKAKPIGTALNEWGKKDVDRIAFEDGHKFVNDRFRVVRSLHDPKDPKKFSPDWTMKEGKKPFEEFFFERLEHRHPAREGFLNLKLEEPRAYDYGRLRTWDERLRMPQFKFARPARKPGENRQQFEERTIREEAEAREAVMTFVLGLVAEQVPTKFVNNPTGDKLAEVKGRQVLDKYNCAGCHLVRPGAMEFKPDYARLENIKNENVILFRHENGYQMVDYPRPEHIGWSGREPVTANRVVAHGTTPPINLKDDAEPTGDVTVRLLQAFRFRQGGKKENPLRDIPVQNQVSTAPNALIGNTPAYGGRFMDQLARYLQTKDTTKYEKYPEAYAAAPPLLVGEGEKVQGEWLYRFLLNPYEIRPLTVLRMPKFNISADEARILTNYFGAVDRTQNPGVGLTYPYVPMNISQESYLEQKTAEYVARLKAANQYESRKKDLQSYWEKHLADEKIAADERLKIAEAALKAAPDAAKPQAQQQVNAAKAAADDFGKKLAQKDVSHLIKRWEEKEAYLADASRLVINKELCLTCHRAGGVEGKDNRGPLLDFVGERLRPDWVEYWINNPNRFLHYDSIMPVNFERANAKYQSAFIGSSKEQIQAARDFLFLYPSHRTNPILRARPVLGETPAPMAPGGGN